MSLSERVHDTIDTTSFYSDAERYELITGTLSGTSPVEFYRRQAKSPGKSVLELACGTGRLSLPLARDGFEVTGLDASDAMLGPARRRSGDSGLSIEWIHGDMRNFDLERSFDRIFIASNAFSHLHSLQDIQRCLAAVRRHLAQSGRLVIDIFNPALGMLARQSDQKIAVADCKEPHSARLIRVSKVVHYDRATQISREIWYFRDEATGEEQDVQLNLRMFFPQEIDSLLHYNGFEIEDKFGDYEETPFRSSSNKQIIRCKVAPKLQQTDTRFRSL